MGNSSSAALPYTIEKEPRHPPTRPGSHGWAIHDATRKSDGGPVTVFQVSKPASAEAKLSRRADPSLRSLVPALHHFHRIKRIVHPRILRAHATLDTDYPGSATTSAMASAPAKGGSAKGAAPGLDALDKTAATGDLVVVTETVVPLDEWLDGLDPDTPQANAAAVSWGVHNLVEALSFLHQQAKLAHGMVCPDAVFVTPGGDFKLGGFDLVTPIGIEDGGGGPTPHFRKYEAAACPDDYRSPERRGGRYDVLQQSAPIHGIDCYSLAVLCEYVYSHPNAGTRSQVPAPLRKALVRMKNDSPRLRPRLQPLLRCPVFDNPYVKAQLFLDEVNAKPTEEKIMFLQSLPDVLSRGVLNGDVAVHKVMPVLIMGLKAVAGSETAMSQEVNRREVLATIPLLFQIAESYLVKDPSLFKLHIEPLVPTLFAINDRGVRGAILQKISLLEKHLEDRAINAQVFEPMCSGFSDSSAPLRELTLKSTIVLVPKLSHSSLEKLVRYLVRLQSDPEASIRTNTVIFIGKIAPSLTEISRSKLILPAFTRAMRDPFTPCRLSALRAVASCQKYFAVRDLAISVLPGVAPHLLDAASEVRTEAFRVVDGLLTALREESGRMAKDESDRVRAATCGIQQYDGGSGSGGGFGDAGGGGGPAAAATTEAAQTSGGYLSGFSSWMSTSATTAAAAPDTAAAAPPDGASSVGLGTGAGAGAGGDGALRTAKPGPASPAFSSLTLSDARIGGASSGGYGGGDSDGGGGWSEDDGDDIGGFSPGGGTSTGGGGGGGGWDDGDGGENDDDFFASFNSAKKPKPGGGKQIGGLGATRLPSSAGTTGGGGVVASRRGMALGRSSSAGSRIKKKVPVAVKKLPASDLMDDGWDDF